MEISPIPICQAMVLCDGFHQRPSTRRISLLETIGGELRANGFPQPWSSIAVYLVLTNGRGVAEFVLRWAGADRESLPGTEQRLSVDFGSPLDTHETVFLCDGLVFGEEGEDFVEVSVAGPIVADRRLFVSAGGLSPEVSDE
jgi:hypothetical protein